MANILTDSKYQKEFCEKLHSAILSGRDTQINIANSSGYFQVKKTRHADDLVLYLHGFNKLGVADYTKGYCPPRMISYLKRECKRILDSIKHNEKRLKAEAKSKQS